MRPTWDASVEIEWGGELRRFRLGMGELRALQDATGRGPEELFRRIQSRVYLVDEVRKTIQLGLEGAGTKPQSAMIAVQRYVDERPLAESVAPAMLILAGALWLPEELDDAGKTEGGEGNDDGLIPVALNYSNGAVMGLSAMKVDEMSLAQWVATCAGWEKAHGGEEKPEAPDAEQYRKMVRMADGER